MIDVADTMRRLTLNVARYSGLAQLGKPILGGVGAILMLHRVTEQPGDRTSINRHLTIMPEFLDVLIGDMKAAGYAFVSMDEVHERMKRGGGTGRFAAITADDAYRDNLVEALPVLERHDVPITIYVAPGLTDGDVDLWWEAVEDIVRNVDLLNMPDGARIDCSNSARKQEAIDRLFHILQNDIAEEEQRDFVRRLAVSAGIDARAESRKSLMNWEEIRLASSHPLVTIGAHTVHHYSLRRLSEDKALDEMMRSADLLEQKLGTRPLHFAFPYGYPTAVGCREVALAEQAGFRTAVTTRHGLIQAGHAGHFHALPRISVNGRYQRLSYMRTMLSGISTPLANRGKVLVTV
jgi:peptidoglycan/xylan/chitin deacetylase (PgdA/CDA1 family)